MLIQISIFSTLFISLIAHVHVDNAHTCNNEISARGAMSQYRGGSEQWTFSPRNSGLLTSFIDILGSLIQLQK